MEQKLINSNWEDKIEVKKGNIGEDIVEKYIEKLSSLIGKLNILVDELDRKSGKNN